MKRRGIAITILLLLRTCIASFIHHDCPASSCGSIPNISYPFRLRGDPLHCGDKRYELDCENNATVLTLFSGKYHVQEIDYKRYKIRVCDEGVVEDATSAFKPHYFLGSGNFSNVFMGPGMDPLHLDQFQASIAYFNCDGAITDDPRYVSVGPTDCASGGHLYAVVRDSRNNFSATDIKVGCQLQRATFANWGKVQDHNPNKNGSYTDIHDMLLHGFGLSWIHIDAEWGSFAFLSMNPPVKSSVARNTVVMPTRGTMSPTFAKEIMIKTTIINFGIHAGLTKTFVLNKATGYDGIVIEIGKDTGRYAIIRFLFGVVAFITLLIHKWRKRHTSNYEHIEDFLRGNTFMPIRYSYKDIKNMTRGFKEKLGQGGYGLVYKGKLRSGSFVAIKMLRKSNANGQEFMSEVATIGRIHHSNVVRLIGFCVEASNCALVYEFMSNGSLDNFIFSKNISISLTYEQIYEISLGVARGIAYLHEGCDMQILHFDIKPHNILLDENFVPKVSDFGLAKLYPLDKSIVTLTAAKGTIGYMAPELFYHNIGGLSYKAD
ncbi:Rust resistance kinase Lr10, partial [Mucuna pruriens]